MHPIEVVIPTYNDFDRLSLALWGYTKQTFKDFLIHISNDGGDNEGTQDVLDKFPELNFQYHYVPPKTAEYRPSLTRNVALAAVKSDRVICTDTDIIPGPNLVERHLKFGPDPIMAVGRRKCIAEHQIGVLLKKDPCYDTFDIIEDDYRAKTKRPWTRLTACSWDAEFVDLNSAIAWDCWSCNISYQTEGLKYLGGFCTTWDGTWGGEDTDLAIRLIKHGHRVAALEDTVGYHLNHPGRANTDWETINKRLCKAWEDKSGNLIRNT